MKTLLKMEPTFRYLVIASALAFTILQSPFASAENASSLYNSGNTHYQNGEYGEAIYAYEKALVLDPGSSDIKSNLALARKTAASFDEARPSQWLGFLYWTGYNQWAKVIPFCLFLLAILSFLRAFRLLDKSPVSLKWPIISIVGLLVLSITALIIRSPELDRAIAIKENTKVRLSPFVTAEVKATLKPGAAVTIKDSHKDYYRVENGWVAKSEVKPVFPE